MSQEETDAKTIRWHQGFRGGIEFLLWPYRDSLQYEEEFVLSKESLKIDLLILKKAPGVKIDTDFGRGFLTHNILEFKSPDDALTIDDFFKTFAYACLYKGLGKTVKEIPAGEVTVSIFRNGYPRELFRDLEEFGAQITEERHGVYRISGPFPFPAQVIVCRQLDPGANAALRILAPNSLESDVKDFLNQSAANTEPGFRENVEAVLSVSGPANHALFEKIRGSYTMSEFLMELMKDEIDKVVAKATAEAAAEANAKAAEATAKANAVAAQAAAANENTAKRLIEFQLTTNQITSVTGLPLEKLQELADSIHVPLRISEQADPASVPSA